jgi:hypothetical protein
MIAAMSDGSTWEERMAARARQASPRYGDPGPPHDPGVCRECWGERQVWCGDRWGGVHAGGTGAGCRHSCHDGEIAMAGSWDLVTGCETAAVRCGGR